MQHKKIAFIGAGNMAFAIISGLVKSGYPASEIIACNKSNQVRRQELATMGINVELSNRQAVEQADVVILAVKPQMMAEVCAEFADVDFSSKWVLSVAAGISVGRLEQLLPSANNIVRSMPNTPSLIGEGLSGLFAKKSVDPTACQFAETLLSAVGQCYWVETEAQLNQIIAITGSSPAYFFRFMEAMQQSAVQMGFSENDARFLVQSVAVGAAKMVVANPNLSLATLRENVTSKGGTTAQALAVFEQHQLADTVNQAMNAAIKRAEEMEKSL
ncbi:pyrroline-5-carboxylate reductase [Ursidibacter maritimus]|uniref:Pyrroline-5-carboxylate reductase n=1 Tax=Ursidibacter maritimus TaxID=1331689 RepID=A0A949T4H6_9PAST|nr:pyrroline-5-carboxylate reductase [Ursidibacter maritimus]KAE9540280.1 pyrroline-5-carboxylate reductase [Ursidibacter maritimus]MBV6524177.1 pyrroline-5-carboxylate reductase [Ursidibacter maritimus]MBV6525661.1 pyrroline-5-carboxylate reductase [Ursidibacter maritimus]MBV6528150.1 pyrroline-5-carboxylate reductase [Ursidibacter maritimus]MBV6528970.1 pyrroline-5-carboxylate reductase [Ursidibacter maritimus]